MRRNKPSRLIDAAMINVWVSPLSMILRQCKLLLYMLMRFYFVSKYEWKYLKELSVDQTFRFKILKIKRKKQYMNMFMNSLQTHS